MDKTISRLTVYFEEPFWVGVFERIEDGKLSACKVTFGAEPKDGEVYDFVLRNYSRLRFSPAVEAHVKQDKRNPKRIQRDVKKQLQNCAAGTKARQALKLQHEQNKTERKVKNRAEKLAEQERLFALKQQKKKQKHRVR